MSLVDLAGSEPYDSTASEDRRCETETINKSLSVVGDVPTAIRFSRPYVRNTCLTFLLQHRLGGGNKCLLIANVASKADGVREIAPTLQFASSVCSSR